MIIKDLSYSYPNKQVLDNVSFSIKDKKITTILGPNGCGKTTMFQLMTKNLKLQTGTICLEDKNINEIKLKEFARKVSIVHQYNTAWPDITVEKLVSYGRVPYVKLGRGYSREDKEKIAWAMNVTGIDSFKGRPLATLSGGQKQRAWIAMALAQNTEILLLDEPTTYLDIKYQIEILRLIKRLNEEYGITIVMVLHDINQAIAFSDEIIGLKDGKVMVCGSQEKELNPKAIEMLYDINLKMETVQGKKVILME